MSGAYTPPVSLRICPLCVAGALLLVGCPSAPDPVEDPTAAAADEPGPLATGVSIRRIALNQTVEATLVTGGELVTPTVPIVCTAK